MTDAHGYSRLKWALDWPVTMSRSPSVNDNLPMGIPNVKLDLIVLSGAIALGLVLVTFQSAFGF